MPSPSESRAEGGRSYSNHRFTGDGLPHVVRSRCPFAAMSADRGIAWRLHGRSWADVQRWPRSAFLCTAIAHAAAAQGRNGSRAGLNLVLFASAAPPISTFGRGRRDRSETVRRTALQRNGGQGQKRTYSAALLVHRTRLRVTEAALHDLVRGYAVGVILTTGVWVIACVTILTLV